MTDRFGILPPEAINLLMKIMLRVLAIKAGAKRLDLSDRQLVLYFSQVHQKRPLALIDMAAQQPKKISFTTEDAMKVVLSPGSPTAQLAQSKNILKEIALHVNPEAP